MQKFILFFLFLFWSSHLFSQVAPDHFRIFFTDKNNSEYSIEYPEAFLSTKAILRRKKQDIPIRENDLPVNKNYLDSLKKLGITIKNNSKWLNTALVYSTDKQLMDTISNLDFIKSSHKTGYTFQQKKTKKPKIPPKEYQLKDDSIFDYGYSTRQISMLNGHILHRNGNIGQGMTIAILDAGFYNVDILPAFDSLWSNNQILGYYDFVDGDNEVFDASSHGMKVLSIMGANLPGELIGTAPKANYWLLRTEQTASEYSIEEDHWVAAAEFADSVGADIINTSLGYCEFDDTALNYTYEDMDGNTAFITKAADIAASKGILVIASAGNQGDDPWQYITAPADGDSILTVGSVNQFAEYSYFSSIGPTYDGRIKPNVVAMGYQTAIQGIDGAITTSNGTSFSAPLISGLAACLWQLYPDLNNMEILQKIEESAHKYSSYDYYTGYGIPDFGKAANLIQTNLHEVSENNLLNIYPNPFYDSITIETNIEKKVQKVYIELFNITGKKVTQDYINNQPQEKYVFTLDNLSRLPSGVYFLRVTIGSYNLSKQISKP
ncbi:MAG TPA: S8 family serine peptidase [Bacteroidales bacterium]|nr:S8 family serine peptidase [Bacteroidales bacterium]